MARFGQHEGGREQELYLCYINGSLLGALYHGEVRVRVRLPCTCALFLAKAAYKAKSAAVLLVVFRAHSESYQFCL